MENRTKIINGALTTLFSIVSLVWLFPLFLVLMNSFKGQFFISDQPFKFPTIETYVKLENYFNGNEQIEFISAFFNSLRVTILSVIAIVLFTSMTSWYISRVKNSLNNMIFNVIIASMIVPFQMVMYPMSKVANVLHLDNPWGLVVIYLGFGAGQAVFMFSGFIKGIPLEIEEAATIDGCNPIQLFFRVVFPILKPISITISILNVMWIWNDFLLPYLVLVDTRTIPMAIQYLQGGYGSKDMGALMAMLILAIIPIVLFYAICQKHIIKGVMAGSVKG